MNHLSYNGTPCQKQIVYKTKDQVQWDQVEGDNGIKCRMRHAAQGDLVLYMLFIVFVNAFFRTRRYTWMAAIGHDDGTK